MIKIYALGTSKPCTLSREDKPNGIAFVPCNMICQTTILSVTVAPKFKPPETSPREYCFFDSHSHPTNNLHRLVQDKRPQIFVNIVHFPSPDSPVYSIQPNCQQPTNVVSPPRYGVFPSMG